MTKLNDLLIKIGKHCKAHRLTIVTAESCTGGGVAYQLSMNKECSSILERGYVTYSPQSKENLLSVKSESIQLEGAVSEEVAKEMAYGALKQSIAQISLAITGIAGEDTENEDEEGIAWVAVAVIDKNVKTKKINFKGKRYKFIEQVIFESLNYMYSVISQK